MIKEGEDHYKLNDGTIIYAYRGLLSINNALDVRQGYDGLVLEVDYSLDNEKEVFVDATPSDIAVTSEHRVEIADYMIGLWTKFKQL